MSQLSYYRTDPNQVLPRPAGLIAWGVIMVAIGSLATAPVLITFGAWAVQSLISGKTYGMPLQEITLLANYGLWGALIICTGVGSIRARIWVRPLVLAEAAVIAILNISLLQRLLRVFQYGLFGPSRFYYTIQGLAAPSIGLGICVAAFLYFRRDKIRDVLRSRNSGIDATDLPADPLFAWSAACVLLGFTNAINALPTRRYFVYPESGPSWILLYALLIAGGLLCYRRIRFAWLATVLLAAVLSIAAAAAFIRLFSITEEIDQFSYLRTMPVNATTGQPHGSATTSFRPSHAFMGARWSAWVPELCLACAYCAATLYGVRVRHYLRADQTAMPVIPLNPTAHTTTSSHTP